MAHNRTVAYYLGSAGSNRQPEPDVRYGVTVLVPQAEGVFDENKNVVNPVVNFVETALGEKMKVVTPRGKKQ